MADCVICANKKLKDLQCCLTLTRIRLFFFIKQKGRFGIHLIVTLTGYVKKFSLILIYIEIIAET